MTPEMNVLSSSHTMIYIVCPVLDKMICEFCFYVNINGEKNS